MSAVRCIQALAVMLATGLLGGCVYDPYTGTYIPCCGYYGYPYYGYPYYRYPPPYYPQTAPYSTAPPPSYATPPQSQPAYPNSPQTQPLPPPQPGAVDYPTVRSGDLALRFAAAIVTHDGLQVSTERAEPAQQASQ